MAAYYSTIVASMIPERVAQRIARGEAVRHVVQKAVVVCIGCTSTNLASVGLRGGAADMIVAMQLANLNVDGALAAVTHDHAFKTHTFGDCILVVIKHGWAAALEEAEHEAEHSEIETHTSSPTHVITFLTKVLVGYELPVVLQALRSRGLPSTLRIAIDAGEVEVATFGRVGNFVACGAAAVGAFEAMQSLDNRIKRNGWSTYHRDTGMDCSVVSLSGSALNDPMLTFLLEMTKSVSSDELTECIFDVGLTTESLSTHQQQQRVRFPALMVRSEEAGRRPASAAETIRNPVTGVSSKVYFPSNDDTRALLEESVHTLDGAEPLRSNPLSLKTTRKVEEDRDRLQDSRGQESQVLADNFVSFGPADEEKYQQESLNGSESIFFMACVRYAVVALCVSIACLVDRNQSTSATSLSIGTTILAATSTVMTRLHVIHEGLFLAIEVVFGALFACVYIFASPDCVFADALSMWVTLLLVLLLQRDRPLKIHFVWVFYFALCVPCFAVGLWRLSSISRVVTGLVTFGCFIAACFIAWVGDLSRREAFLTDRELQQVQERLRSDASNLAALLERMMPNRTFAALLTKVRDVAHAHRSTLAADRFPRHFGLRGSLFATKIDDIPLVMLDFGARALSGGRVAAAAAASATSVDGDAVTAANRRLCFAALEDVLDCVEGVSLIKTDGNYAMLAEDGSADPCDKAAVLARAVAYLVLLGTARGFEFRCVATAGPVSGAVLGTAALSFEFFGPAVSSALAMLQWLNRVECGTVATSKFCDLMRRYRAFEGSTDTTYTHLIDFRPTVNSMCKSNGTSHDHVLLFAQPRACRVWGNKCFQQTIRTMSVDCVFA